MSDHSSKRENSDELRTSRDVGFFEKSKSIRLLIGLVFMLSLFVTLHFREVRVEMLELNSTAPKYVVAQVDFDFFDEEATIISKQEAVRYIGKIYHVPDKETRARRIEFENFLVYNDGWREQLQGVSFEEMYQAAETLEKVLVQLRLTDPRTLQKIKELKLSPEDYQIYAPADISEAVIFPKQVWKTLKKRAFSEGGVPPEVSSFVMDYFQKKKWILEEDIPAQRALRRRIQSNVVDKFTHVSAGSRIIDQGEKVTTRHIAMLMAMKKSLGASRNLWHPVTLFGSLVMTLLLTGICVTYFRIYHPKLLSSNRKLALLVTVTVLTLGLAKLAEFFLLTSQSNLFEIIRYPLFVPFIAILLASLMNSSIAIFMSTFLAVVFMMSLAFERQAFLLVNLSAAFVAVLSTQTLKRRKEVFVVCLKTWLCCAAVIVAFHLYQNTSWSVGVAADLLSTAVFMLLTGVLIVGLLPLLESVFGIMTNVSLMEYMDPNNDVLRRLVIEAPGTYQHSVVVGNLAESAAISIGANGLFCRVATLYHDIGKMVTPQYFTENQQGGMDIHQLLTPQESAQVIIAHVTEGVNIARKAGLPEKFIDIIKEHHGTTLSTIFTGGS